ncbi:conserved hypothetical protein [Nitrosococcus oceani ATCC 19707]|uniref:Nal1 N-terminal domain-containing protein n=2 Tax=Nitrosococcus oceani TaxID=1229 RepID=Q3JA35_NITOC|nr:hypothetical protein [Nitrosococcus oceani]ABA58311.1 conserved hypothetical protein [Nitrosococcus oceani ATCC 19707]EDZ66706.1 hypothetical protein NOC27_33 [Nitrosococcus oceani AFC27]KFI19241.1 hypothetical protein IB75_09800 [Nitrosococcus oceani C-27]GEM18696.1 hypothetical protein NONS58_00520 [Nitrosococcus oceani]
MKKDEKKMVLSPTDIASAQKAYSAVVGSFLDPRKQLANVIGMGIGVKWTKGEPTGKPALVVLVTQKLAKNELSPSNMVPNKLQEMQTDVLAIGYPLAGQAKTSIQTLGNRVRPAEGGYSVGHKDITAGTIATCVYDILPEGSVSPPSQGIGIPSNYYLLSNNHVLANSNAASLGDSILQPGPYDGGTDPADRIASLSRFIPITFDPPVPQGDHNNLVDAAIAQVEFQDADRKIYWIGDVRGWRQKRDVAVGMPVKKTGRTTHFTMGRITAINATVNVGYGGGKVARFRDQIITTPMSAGGDSGSLVTTLDNIAVGLLFAGSSVATIVNQIENVRSLLRVEVAEQIL